MGQEVIVIALISVATGYLGWHFWHKHRTKSGCKSCRLMQHAQKPQVEHKRAEPSRYR